MGYIPGSPKPAKGTPWTTKNVNNLFANVRKLQECIANLTNAMLGTVSPSNYIPSESVVYVGTLNAGDSVGGPAPANARSVEAQFDTAGPFEITIEKTDGSIMVFRTFGNSAWTYESRVNQAPVSVVTVTNLVGSPDNANVIINIAS